MAMADLNDLGYKSIIDMETDEAIDTLRQIRLSRRVPEKKVKTRETTKQTTKKVSAALDSGMAAELLKLLGGKS